MNTLKFQARGNPKNPAILFLHAFPLTGQMWKDQFDLFSEKYYCVAPDLPGFGESPLPDYPFTFEHYVDAALQFLKEQKIEKSVWCGLSMGGYLALRMYEKAADHCRALILCDTKSGADGNEAKIKRAGAIQLLRKSRSEFNSAQWQALIGESSKNQPSLKTKFDELIGKSQDLAVATGLVVLATRTDSTADLSKIRVPTLIIVGEEDKVTPPSEAEAMHKAISGSELKTLAKVGHLSNLENPKAFNESLTSFLQRALN